MKSAVAAQTLSEQSAPGMGGRGKSPARSPAPTGVQADILTLQRAAGNRAVDRLLQPPAPCALPGASRTMPNQLTVNEAGDEYEQDAERLAAQVMRMTRPGDSAADWRLSTAPPPQPRAAAGDAGASYAPPIVHDVLSSPGQILDSATREFFEPRFGYDFSQVRVHADAKAVESAKAINASGYTVSPHIVLPSSATRSLIAHELSHVVQQSRSVWSTKGSSALVQRSPAPMESTRKTSPTDEELLRLLDRFPQGEPIVLYHVSEDGGLLKSVEQKGKNFRMNRAGELNLTTNVEARTSFKGGAGLDNIIAFYLDRRFVQLMGETAVTQRVAGQVERFFNKIMQDQPITEEWAGRMVTGERPVLAVPRFTFEGGGAKQGRAFQGTGDFNIALRSYDRVSEWNRLFKLSIRRIEHLRYDESRPAGSRLVRVAQLYPLLTGPVRSPDRLLIGPIGVPVPPEGAGPGDRRMVPGTVPEEPGPASGSSSLATPRSSPEHSFTAPPRDLAVSTAGKGALAMEPLEQNKTATEPPALSPLESRLPTPSASGTKGNPVAAASRSSVKQGQTSEFVTKANEAINVSPPRLLSEKGEAAALGSALLMDAIARAFADSVTGQQTQEAQHSVDQLTPQIVRQLEMKPDIGAIITVAYSQRIPDLFGVDPEGPRVFLWASFDLVRGQTLIDAKRNFDTLYPEPGEGELRDYRYQWFPPSTSTESPQGWHSVQYNQSKPWYRRLHEWLQGYQD